MGVNQLFFYDGSSVQILTIHDLVHKGEYHINYGLNAIFGIEKLYFKSWIAQNEFAYS